jgi:PAS domain S-box-containing protein
MDKSFITVLLIEDNPTDIILLREALAENPLNSFRLETAERLSTGLQWLQEHTCDVILLDLGLPDSQGLATFTHLAQQTPTIPIIVLSGQANETLAVEAVQAGAQDYLVKGYSNSALLGRAIHYAIERQRAQMALQNSERRFRTLIEKSTDVITLVDAEGIILYQSPAIARILGYLPEEMVGQSAFDFLHPDDLAASVKSLVDGLQQPDISLTSQFRYLHKDGHQVWLEGIGTNRLAEEGVEAIVVNSRDITERIQAEEALRSKHQLEEQVAHIAETAPGALCSFRQAPDGTFHLPYVSRAWESLMGVTQDEVRHDATPVWQRIYPDDLEPTTRSIQMSAQNMSPWRTEFRLVHPQQGIVWLEGHSTPTPQPDGSILWHGFITDISERKKAEDAIRTQAFILENIDQGVNYVDEQAIIRYTNRAFDKMFGYERGELIGQPVSILNDLPPEENARYIESVMTTLQTQGYWAGELYNRQKDGTPMLTSAHVTGMPMYGQLFAITVQEDITERNQAERDLRESEERFRSFIEQLNEGVTIVDDEGLIVVWNQAQECITGIPRSQALGQQVWQIQRQLLRPDHPLAEHLEKLIGIVRAQFTTKQPSQLQPLLEVEIETSAGEQKFISLGVFPIKQGDGYFMGSLTRDITTRKRMEEALQSSEERYRTLTEQIPAIAYIEDASHPVGQVLYISPQVESVLGISQNEWLNHEGNIWQDHIHPDDRERIVTEYRACFGERDSFDAEYRMVTDEGLVVWIHDQARVILSQDGKQRLIHGVFHDVTTHKMASLLIQQQAEYIRLLYDASQALNWTLALDEIYETVYEFVSKVLPGDSLIISSYDAAAQLMTCNAFWANHKQLDVSHFPAIPLEPEGFGTQSLAIRSGQALLINDYQTWLKQTQTTYYVNDETGELVDEPLPDVDITRSALIVPLKLNGQVTGVLQILSYKPDAYQESQLHLLESLALHIASAQQNALLYEQMQTELAERKLAEQALRQNEQLLRAIIDNATGLVWVKDVEGRFLIMNRYGLEVINLPYEQVLDHTVHDLFPADLAIAYTENDRRVLATGQPAVFEETDRRDGQEFTYLATKFPLRDTQGQIYGLGAICTDITVRKQMEQSLRESEEWLRLAVDAGDLGTWRQDVPNEILHLDDRGREIYGCTQNDVPAHVIRERIHPDDRLLMNESVQNSLERQDNYGQFRAEYRYAHPDNTIHWLSLQARVTFAGEGANRQAVLGVGTVQDITKRKQLELALQESEALLKAIVESALDAIVTVDAEQRIVLFNAAAEKMFQCAAADAIGQPMSRFIPARFHQIHTDSPALHDPFTTKVAIDAIGLHPDGNEFPLEVSFAQIEVGGRHLRTGIIRDVTERKEAEKTIQAERQHFRDLFQNSPIATWLEDFSAVKAWLDGLWANGVTDIHTYLTENPEQMATVVSLIRVVDVNQAAVSQNAALDKEHLITSMAQLLTSETYPDIRQEIEAIWNNQISMEFALNGHRLDGQPLTAIIRMDVPEWAGKADYSRVIITSTDITELNRAEKALRESEERLGGIVASAMDAIITIDEAQNVVLFNAAAERMFGCLSPEIMGQSINRFVPQRFHHTHSQDIQQFSHTNTTSRVMGRLGELRAVRTDGTEFPIEASISQTAAAGKRLFTVILRDITERKQMENALTQERNLLASRVTERTATLSQANAELARANRLKDEFLSNMSHELRTPLNAILNLSESLQEGVYGPINDEQNETLRIIGESGSHLLELINDILDLSKIEADKLQLLLTPVNIETICQATVRMSREPAIKKRLKIVMEIESFAPTLIADERRLKQILVNLLSNAIKFTPEGGQIGLEVVHDAAAEAVRFTVWDTGIGIAHEHLPSLFKPFVQLDSTLSRQYSGTGLGLALVQRLVELHGGSFGVESEPGQGSRFFFTLPITPLDAILAQNQIGNNDPIPLPTLYASPPSGQLPTDAPLILIVEDNPINIKSLSDYLAYRGYRTMLAINGTEAIQMTLENHPHLIIMDVQMPELDGLEITRRLRQLPEFVTTPIIALTALAMPSDRERCLQAGMNHYVTKPVNLKGFIQLVNSILHPQFT